MNADTYLSQIRKWGLQIKNRKRDYALWLDKADGYGGSSSGDRVQASRNLHICADAIGNYIDIERDIERLMAKRDKAIGRIESLPKDEYSVLYAFYVDGKLLKTIALDEGRSYRWVEAKKSRGLALVQKMIDEEL